MGLSEGFILLVLLLLFIAPLGAQPLGVELEGDEAQGYTALLTWDEKPLTRSGDGELALVFENSLHTEVVNLPTWRASKGRLIEDGAVLVGEALLTSLGAKVKVEVVYKRINPSLVSKRVTVTQQSGPALFWQLTSGLRPTEKADSCWTFEHERHPGGFVYEVFPAIGFRTDGLAVGLLTDSGSRNLWTRSTRVRQPAVWQLMPTPLQLDCELERVLPDSAGVEFTFGRLRDCTQPEYEPLELPPLVQCRSLNGVKGHQESEAAFRLTGQRERDDLAGLSFPIRLRQNELYEISFTFRGEGEPAVRLWNEHATRDICPYEQAVVVSQADGSKQVTQRFFTYALGDLEAPCQLFVGRGPGGIDTIDSTIEDFTWQRLEGVNRSYHPLELGVPATRTLFVFAQPSAGQRDLKLACQTRLAEGLGYGGSQADKIFAATATVLTWTTEPADLTPLVVPSVNYQPDMYLRDAFWIVASLEDREASEAVWSKYAATLDDAGRVATLATPYIVPPTNLDNDSNLFFVILAYLNHKRYGTAVDMPVLEQALSWLRSQVDEEGRYLSRTPGWLDTIWLQGQANFASNQGLWEVALRCAKELGCAVPSKELQKASDAYEALWDKERGYLLFGDRTPELLSPTSLVGEALSWWLWEESLLPAGAVIDTVAKLPLMGDCIPCLVKADGTFLQRGVDEVARDMHYRGGVYHNGGTWLLYEYLAYMAAGKHGWPEAQRRMQRRLAAEFRLQPNEPVSHEWLPLTGDPNDFWPITRVYGWNCFVRIANQVAARKPGEPFTP